MEYKWMVCVKCQTFNHSSFVNDAMDGFCRQETSFPFVCVIIDDASTDGEQDVLQCYLNNHFDLADGSVFRNEETDDYTLTFARHKSNENCFFAVYYLKYNHYRKKAKDPYLNEWVHDSKYVALCEGDDYWINSRKLQRQVDFLEKNTDYTMACSRVKLYSEKKKDIVGEDYCYTQDATVKTKDVIYRTGLFISTCSIVYKNTIKENYPDYCWKCAVGDYPLQIMAAMKGRIYYFNDPMSVYRFANPGSWTAHQNFKVPDAQRIKLIKSRIRMLAGFSTDFPEFKHWFQNKINDEIRRNIPERTIHEKEYNDFVKAFSKEISQFSLPWRIDFLLRSTKLPFLRRYYKWSGRLFYRFCYNRLYY